MLTAECFFLFLNVVQPFCILGQTQLQTKHETGHVQFRVLREKPTGQNSLQLFISTSTNWRPVGTKVRQASAIDIGFNPM